MNKAEGRAEWKILKMKHRAKMIPFDDYVEAKKSIKEKCGFYRKERVRAIRAKEARLAQEKNKI